HGGYDANVEARGSREPRDDVAVAGVVARAAEHGDAPRGGPALAQHAERRGAGAAHQLVARYAELVDRDAIDRPDLIRRVDVGRQRVGFAHHRAIILRARQPPCCPRDAAATSGASRPIPRPAHAATPKPRPPPATERDDRAP